MQPEPASCIAGSSARQVRNVPRAFTSMTRSHCWSESSVTSCSKNTPAALTSSHGAPSSAVTASRSPSTAASLRRSQPNPRAPVDRRGGALGILGAEVAAGDAEPLAREPRGDGGADAAGGAGHERDAIAHSCSRIARVIAVNATHVRYMRSGSSSTRRRLRGPVRSTPGSQLPSSA